jgi:outer membrane murein-binding lipoprotein Lpp
VARRDLLSKLADAGEEAIGKLADAPGADRLAGVATSMRERVDDLQKKVRGIEALEARIAVLERRLDAMESKKPGARKPAARKPAARASSKATGGKRASAKDGGAATPRTGGGGPGESPPSVL